jgi:[acyl-carrier-protein] S-malonyltransferase
VKSKIVEKECRNVTNDIAGAYIACYNSPFQVMVSGNSDEVLRLEDRIIEIPGAQITPLMNGAPFHSPIMKEAALKLKYELSKYKFDRAEWPVISNFTARPYDNDKEKIIDNIVNQLISPVRWQDTMEYLKKQKVEAVVEIGPKAVLCNLVKENSKDIDAFSYENIDDINSIVKLSKEVKAINIPDQNFITRCLVAAVSTKNRNWDNAKYKKGVIDSYRFIEEMQNNLESENLQPTKEQMLILLEHLKKILITKKLPQEKQLEIFNKIFSDTGTSDYFHNFEI